MSPARRPRWLLLALFSVVAMLVVLLGYGYAETYWLEIKEYRFDHPDVPPSFAGVRIAFVSDIHRSPFFSQARVRSVVERVNALEPDLVILGGDYVYLGTHYASSCFAELAYLRAPLGRFAVLGNHDYNSGSGESPAGPRTTLEAIKQAGITPLVNEGVWIYRGSERIRLGGVSDYRVDHPDVETILSNTHPQDFVLLVSHNPDYCEQLPPNAVDLVLSGHTHGGQVTLFGLWAPFVPSEHGNKYRTGMITGDTTTVIVSNGIGTSTIPPIRIGARPQIVLVTLSSP